MFRWLRKYQRRRYGQVALPAAWEMTLSRTARFRDLLAPQWREKLDRATTIFVHEKNWEGCGGLLIQDEHRVTIAAHAVRLTLGFEEDYWDDVQSILLYPTPYTAPTQDPIGSGVVLEGESERVGEAWYRGPVVLAWSDISECILPSPLPSNVILHEFAHQLDYRNGSEADGIPAIESREQAEEWVMVCGTAYDRLCRACKRRQRTALDEYGATSQAEFFAVATEGFFESPHLIAAQWPDLFRVLSRFYRQDPRS